MSDPARSESAATEERIVSGADAKPWTLPRVGSTVAGPAGGMMTAGRLEAIEREARESGHAAGYAAGMEAASAELERRVQVMDQVLVSLARPLQHFDDEIEKELVELVLAAARRLIRRELKTDPGEIVAVVREGIAALPVGERAVRVHLHPEDAALVTEAFGACAASPACRIIPDPTVTRGGANISTEVSFIDATLETRIARVCDRLLGNERQERQEAAE